MPIPSSLAYGLPSVVVLLLIRHFWNGRHHYPPGPPQDPFIGSKQSSRSWHTYHQKSSVINPLRDPDIRNAPKDKPCLTWEEWGKTYGPIVYMNVIGKPYIIINSYEVARELLEKGGQKYSDRPRFIMAGELVGKCPPPGRLPYLAVFVMKDL